MTYFNYPIISIIQTPLGPEVFGLVKVYSIRYFLSIFVKERKHFGIIQSVARESDCYVLN